MYAASFICCGRLICNSVCFPNTPRLPSSLHSNLPLSLSSTHFCYRFRTVCLPIYLNSNPQWPPSHCIPSPHLTSPHLTHLHLPFHIPSPPSPHLLFLIPFHPLIFLSPIPSPHLPLPRPLPLPCQVCSESPSKDLSTKLHNMSAMFGLYYKRDGRYNKGSEMWASGLCRYLHDAYPALTMQVLKLLTEVCMAPVMYGIGVFIEL